MYHFKHLMMNKKIQLGLMVISLIAISISAVSCFAHVNGNGKVVKEDRNIAGFEAITVNNGIDVLVSQDTFEKVVVEADENIQKILRTEVRDGKLKIFLEEGVNEAKRMKVYVTVKQLNTLDAGSGSEVKSGNQIKAEKMKIHSSSGSDVTMEINCNEASLESSSGSDLTVSGTVQSLKAGSSSGSDLNASKLIAEKGDVSASSGSDLSVHVTKELKAHASSGSDITVHGNPALRDSNSSSGGDISYR